MSTHSANNGRARHSDATQQQYGVIPWRRDKHDCVRVLLITSRTHHRWIVPKGWPIQGRAAYMSAALEAFEEAGVIGDIQTRPIATYHHEKNYADGTQQYRRVTLFGMRVRGTLTNWPEREERQRRWFSLDEAAEVIGDRELADILEYISGAPEALTTFSRSAAITDVQQPAPSIATGLLHP